MKFKNYINESRKSSFKTIIVSMDDSKDMAKVIRELGLEVIKQQNVDMINYKFIVKNKYDDLEVQLKKGIDKPFTVKDGK